MNYVPEGIIPSEEMLNLKNNIPGVSKRMHRQVKKLSTTIEWNDAIETVNKDVE
jgi:hypothetical protein